MLVVPKQKAVFSNLNTHYLHMERLLEHLQGDIGAGCLVLRSAAAGGVIYFDPDEILNGYYYNRREKIHGKAAVAKLIDPKTDHNFNVDVYQLPREEVYFWTTTTTAKVLYKDLSTEFTELEGLLKKMRVEKLTGYIEVALRKNGDSGLIFLSGGEVVGGSFSWLSDASPALQTSIDKLVQKSKQLGGVFQVSCIPPAVEPQKKRTAAPDAKLLQMLEEFLSIFETLYRSKRSRDVDFNTLIRSKFVEKAEDFAFLDPFAAEFEYVDRKIVLNDAVQETQLVEGVTTSMFELAEEINLGGELKKYLNSWFKKYDTTLKELGIR